MMDFARIPHWVLDLIGAGNCPAVPLALEEFLETLVKLRDRGEQVKPALEGLSAKYTIHGITATAYEWLFGDPGPAYPYNDLKIRLEGDASVVFKELIESDAPTGAVTAVADQIRPSHPLESPDQWAISWTQYAGVLERAKWEVLPAFAGALDPAHPNAASAAFWPTIAKYALNFNLPCLEKVRSDQRLSDIKNRFAQVWSPKWEQAYRAGQLFAIDLSLFEKLPYDSDNKRFTPATVTLLLHDPTTKQLSPVAVRVSGGSGQPEQVYLETSPSWLYGLQAARTSVTVYGIWLGHVYHFHMITAAMLLSAWDTIPENADPALVHPIRQLLAPQSKWLFGFDDVLLKLWSTIAPPTSVASWEDFLRLMSQFAVGRTYLQDDPQATLDRNGIDQADFSLHSAWDQFPIAGTFLRVWDYTKAYVDVFVNQTYPPGKPPSADPVVQNWIRRASETDGGNVPGLPVVNTNDDLGRVLTSLVYRITMHGSARLLSTGNPGLMFVANFPPCLQKCDIPTPDTPLTPQSLFDYLPTTGTIGLMVSFIYTFGFSRPYESFVPPYGLDSNLFFPGGPTAPRNAALIDYRRNIQGLIDELSPVSPPAQSQRYQWPLSIET
jgi:hypothetical protein